MAKLSFNTSPMAIWIVVILATIIIGDALRIQHRSIIDEIEKEVEKETEKLLPGNFMDELKKLAKDESMSPDCKQVIQECIDTKGAGNCKKDVKDCAEEAFFGAKADPKYSNMGPDIDLPGLMQDISTEIGMVDGTAVAKKILTRCMSYQNPSFLSTLESLFQKKQKLSVQADFLCRALTGKDLGEYRDVLSAPQECSKFDNEKGLCKASVGRKALPLVFKEYYPKLVASAKSDSDGGIDFKECWDKEDRVFCVAALLIGRICQPACPIASCTYEQLKKDDKCSAKLKPEAAAFFKSANSQCSGLADAMEVSGIGPCKNPEPQKGPQNGSASTVSLGIGIALFGTAMFGR